MTLFRVSAPTRRCAGTVIPVNGSSSAFPVLGSRWHSARYCERALAVLVCIGNAAVGESLATAVASTSRTSVPTGSPSIRASCSRMAADVDPVAGSSAYLAAGDSSNLFTKPTASHSTFKGSLSLRPFAGNAQRGRKLTSASFKASRSGTTASGYRLTSLASDRAERLRSATTWSGRSPQGTNMVSGKLAGDTPSARFWSTPKIWSGFSMNPNTAMT